MLIVDRVLCDCCGQPMGQLYNQSAPQPDLLPDLRVLNGFAPDKVEGFAIDSAKPGTSREPHPMHRITGQPATQCG